MELMMDDKEYQNLLEHNLAVLGTFGFEYVTIVSATAKILHQYINGEIQLSQEDLQKMSDIAVKVSEKHLKMLRMTVEERLNYADPDKSS